MKQGIHPTWYKDAKISCVCGNAFTIGSILSEIRVEICSNCHPFYTGRQRLIDTQGQVEKFSRKTILAQEKRAEREKIQAVRMTKVQVATTKKPTLKDLLLQARKRA